MRRNNDRKRSKKRMERNVKGENKQNEAWRIKQKMKQRGRMALNKSIDMKKKVLNSIKV